MAREGAFSMSAGSSSAYHGSGHGPSGAGGGWVIPPGGGYPPPNLHHDDSSKSYEPSDVFCALGSLIAEGRLPSADFPATAAPSGGDGQEQPLDMTTTGNNETPTPTNRNSGRGYTEGPHVEMPGRISRHKCSSDQRLCTKHENFRRHMLLLWQNNVSMSIEVLLCSDCRVGEDKAGSLEVTTVPEPGSILLEQWRLSITNSPGTPGGTGLMDYLGLHQAVRSYLHFSQLSAWYNKSGGRRPKNVLIRVTMAGEEFASKFSRAPEEHLFPSVHVSHGSTVSVSVRALPRTEEIPTVVCSHNNNNNSYTMEKYLNEKDQSIETSETFGGNKSTQQAPLPTSNNFAFTSNAPVIPGALNWRDPASAIDLRRTIVYNKAKMGGGVINCGVGNTGLAGNGCTDAALQGNTGGPGGQPTTSNDCPGGRLVKSDSMDSILGDSLLDPPQNINKMTPRRYQSPSRCGSPSLEAPEHLLSGGSGRRNVEAWLGGHQSTSALPTYEQAMINSRYMTASHHPEDPEMFRLNRHDLIRRRDMGLYRGMHPRMIYPGMPRLSLPTYRAAAPGLTANNPAATLQQPIRPSPVLGLPYYSSNLQQQTASQLPGIITPTDLSQSAAAVGGSSNDHRRPNGHFLNDQSMNDQQRSHLMTAEQQQHVVTDQLPNYCTRSGKHICDNEDFEDLVSSSRRAAPQGFVNLQQPQPTTHHQLVSSLALSGSQYQHSRESSNSSEASSSNNSSLISGSPTGDNYKQCELGAKAKGWTARTGRSSTPYGRDSSTDSAEIRNTKKGNSSSSKAILSQQHSLRDCGGGHHVLDDGELSPGEMDEVLAHLRSRMSPVAGGKSSPVSGGRRPSLKDDQQQLENIILHNKISRRSSIDKLLDPQGIKVSPQVCQVYRAELGIPHPSITKPSQQHHGQYEDHCTPDKAAVGGEDDISDNTMPSKDDDSCSAIKIKSTSRMKPPTQADYNPLTTDTSSSSSNSSSISTSLDYTEVNTFSSPVSSCQQPATDLQQHSDEVQQQYQPPQQQDDRGSILLGAILKHSTKSRDLQAWIHSAKHTIQTTFRQPSKPVVDGTTQPQPESDAGQEQQNLTSLSPVFHKETSPVNIITQKDDPYNYYNHKREAKQTDTYYDHYDSNEHIDENGQLLSYTLPHQTKHQLRENAGNGNSKNARNEMDMSHQTTKTEFTQLDEVDRGYFHDKNADFYSCHPSRSSEFHTDYNFNSCNGTFTECQEALDLTPTGQPASNINLLELCNQMEKKCLISKQAKDEEKSSKSFLSSPLRTRSYSEAHAPVLPHFHFGEPVPVTGAHVLEPLDMSFEYHDHDLSYDHEESGGASRMSLYESGISFEGANSNGGIGDQSESYDENDEDVLLNMRTKPEKRRNSIEDDANIPSANKKAAFRKSFDSATSMVFHSRNGLPLTSSPAPMRRGIKFDFDSGISTPKDIKRALFESQYTESINDSLTALYANAKKKKRDPRRLLSTSAPATVNNNLLGNFEESVLNGRLEPVSTVEGFTAEIGASGSFHPRHLTLPVTVFFYTLCENSNIASPYLGHVNLGKKGYRVPDKGTIQLTLFNPLGTVVKMFVVMYDLTDMPPNSQTFLRQRTLYMPADASESDTESRKWLRYLIHLRMASSKTGKIYLHTDIRMIIFRKSDLDTASDHAQGKGFELRSFTKGPSNPKFSPRK